MLKFCHRATVSRIPSTLSPMRPDVVYHYSEEPNIEVFHPRAPLRHPDEEPLVYAIDEWHSPLYYFPRDCPRVGVWPLPDSDEGEVMLFNALVNQRMLLAIDQSWEVRHKAAKLYRYTFSLEGFEETGDHGCWVSRDSQIPIDCSSLTDLPKLIENAGAYLGIVPDLAKFAREWPVTTTMHVSMIRMSNLPNWKGLPGTPVRPKPLEPKE